jgi:predicted Zn finger-like uncharacterized protein
MYTRCPHCQTVFHVSPAQLEARGGMVRCGICANAFRADQNLFETLPSDDIAPATRADTTEEITRTEPIEPPTGTAPADDLPLMNEFPLARKRGRVPTALWWLGGLLLLALLAAQAAYFYAPQLARDARLKPWLALYCEKTGCDIKPARGVLPIDLAQTAVAPHPRYENALRLSAVLVNRAETVQPYPLMEVALTDSEGKPLARRPFAPAQYLLAPAAANGLTPNVAVRAQIDVTNVDGRAVGYEIRLVAAPE